MVQERLLTCVVKRSMASIHYSLVHRLRRSFMPLTQSVPFICTQFCMESTRTCSTASLGHVVITLSTTCSFSSIVAHVSGVSRFLSLHLPRARQAKPWKPISQVPTPDPKYATACDDLLAMSKGAIGYVEEQDTMEGWTTFGNDSV